MNDEKDGVKNKDYKNVKQNFGEKWKINEDDEELEDWNEDYKQNKKDDQKKILRRMKMKLGRRMTKKIMK